MHYSWLLLSAGNLELPKKKKDKQKNSDTDKANSMQKCKILNLSLFDSYREFKGNL